VLIQVTRNKNTRTYSDYETVSDAMGGQFELLKALILITIRGNIFRPIILNF
jgi:hypothetical protein